MSSVSDLFVSGCSPLGILLSCQWKFSTSQATKRAFFLAASRALSESGVPLLGGDSGASTAHVFTSTILGESRIAPLSRMGALPGDSLFLTATRGLGAGPALAARFLLRLPPSRFPETRLRPRPVNLRRSRRWIRASIDTSDGLMVAGSTLALINNIGLNLYWNARSLMPAARRFAISENIPEPWLWMNDLGDLQGLAVVAKDKVRRIQKMNPDWLLIGAFVKKPGLTFFDPYNQRAVPHELLHHEARTTAELRRHFRRTLKFWR